MLRYFDWLARIENNLQKLDTLLESLSLLEVLEFDARSLTDFIDTRAIKLAAGNERLSTSSRAFPTELLTIYGVFSSVSWCAASPNSRFQSSTARSSTRTVYSRIVSSNPPSLCSRFSSPVSMRRSSLTTSSSDFSSHSFSAKTFRR